MANEKKKKVTFISFRDAGILRECGEKCEKVEEEKLNHRKTMQQERKEFSGQLLSSYKCKRTFFSLISSILLTVTILYF